MLIQRQQEEISGHCKSCVSLNTKRQLVIYLLTPQFIVILDSCFSMFCSAFIFKAMQGHKQNEEHKFQMKFYVFFYFFSLALSNKNCFFFSVVVSVVFSLKLVSYFSCKQVWRQVFGLFLLGDTLMKGEGISFGELLVLL